MKIVIAGSGDTGTHLAKMLSFEKQDVVLMSGQKEYLDSIDATYNLMTFYGDPTSPSALRDAGAGDADLFIGVTPCGTHNIASCQIARHLGVKSTVARVESEEYISHDITECFKATGVDATVYPEALAADDIYRFIKHDRMISRHELHGGSIVFSVVKIAEGSPAAGSRLRDYFGPGRKFHVVAIRRHGKLTIPHGNDILEVGDIAYFTYLRGADRFITDIVGQQHIEMRNIMICGEVPIARNIISQLNGHGVNITYMNSNRSECLSMANEFPDIAVSNSQPKDIESLKEEGIAAMDLFVALGNDSSANIVASLIAKEFGVKRIVAQIEDIDYMAEAERLGIDKVINKKLITSGVILQSILENSMRVNTVLALEDVEVAEIVVGEGARISRTPVKDLNLPGDMTLGGLVRNGEGVLIEGATCIEPGDIVLAVFMPGSLSKIEKFFKA